MNGRGYRAEALHGGMDQSQRDRVMARLRDGTAELLVATDVAARGLDVDTLTHVVNYDVPSAAESYVHRIGRVGRAGREGTAITLAEPRERRQLENIERLTKQTITVAKVPSVADLRSRQIELTVAQVRESLASADLEDYNSILHALTGDDSERNIALAAIKLVHAERGAMLDEREIPDASERFRNEGKKGDRKNYEGKSYDGKQYDGKKKFDKHAKFDKGKRQAARVAKGRRPRREAAVERRHRVRVRQPRPQRRHPPRRPRRRDRQRDRSVGSRDRPDPHHRQLLRGRRAGRLGRQRGLDDGARPRCAARRPRFVATPSDDRPLLRPSDERAGRLRGRWLIAANTDSRAMSERADDRAVGSSR